jgi:hypothetical protein
MMASAVTLSPRGPQPWRWPAACPAPRAPRCGSAAPHHLGVRQHRPQAVGTQQHHVAGLQAGRRDSSTLGRLSAPRQLYSLLRSGWVARSDGSARPLAIRFRCANGRACAPGSGRAHPVQARIAAVRPHGAVVLDQAGDDGGARRFRQPCGRRGSAGCRGARLKASSRKRSGFFTYGVACCWNRADMVCRRWWPRSRRAGGRPCRRPAPAAARRACKAVAHAVLVDLAAADVAFLVDGKLHGCCL